MREWSDLPVRQPRALFAVTADRLAPALLGCTLVRVLDDGTRLAGVIVETEAYVGVRDMASHARGGRRTARNEPMYAAPGTVYVYFTYGMHWCFNVVCAEVDVPHAVLVRAVEPTEGLEAMRAHRRAGAKPARTLRDVDLCRGPARLTQAMAIAGALSGADMTADPRLWIEPPARGAPPVGIARSARIGVESAGAPWAGRRLRYFVAGSPFVSGPRTVSQRRTGARTR